MITGIRRLTLSEEVVDRIKLQIADRSLKPGDRLPTEQQLADQFGVSRVSIREATKALSYLGILRSSPRRGLRVGELDMRRISDCLSFHFTISDYPKELILQSRIVIEIGCLPYAVDGFRKDPSLWEALSELVGRLDTERNLDRFIEGDIAFHRGLVAASRIEPLMAFNGLLETFFQKYRKSVMVSDRKAGNRVHRRILEALRVGRVEQAQKLLREHLDYHKGRL